MRKSTEKQRQLEAKKLKELMDKQEKPQDWYNVNGIRYLREDLVTAKVDNIMERIAIAQETQANFYKKYDKMMSPLIDTYMKTIAEQVEIMKRRGGSHKFPFS